MCESKPEEVSLHGSETSVCSETTETMMRSSNKLRNCACKCVWMCGVMDGRVADKRGYCHSEILDLIGHHVIQRIYSLPGLINQGKYTNQ